MSAQREDFEREKRVLLSTGPQRSIWYKGKHFCILIIIANKYVYVAELRAIINDPSYPYGSFLM